MANNDEAKSSKSDKSSSPAPPDQTNVHVYPDWAAMQAYYGPRVALPPYYNSAVASGHAPHPYMWAPPQHMIPPYGGPYAAVYPHGGVYARPAVPIVATPVSAETPTKSSGNTEQGLVKKLKGLDGIAMSIGNGNGNAGSAEDGDCRMSQSTETEGSSDGSDGNTSGGRKRSCNGTPTSGGDVKTKAQPRPLPIDKALGVAIAPTIVSSGALEPKNSPNLNAAKTSPNGVPQPCAVLPPETLIQNERELKRERRKQSNRESARRSRLRKQAETEELAHKVEGLTAENVALQSEISQLAELSEKLRLENAALMEKLKNSQSGQARGVSLNGIDEERAPVVNTENLLSRVNNSALVDNGEEIGPYERNSNTGAKLHQLLDASCHGISIGAQRDIVLGLTR